MFSKVPLGLNIPSLKQNPPGSRACSNEAGPQVLTIWQRLILENPGEVSVRMSQSSPRRGGPEAAGSRSAACDGVTGLWLLRISTGALWPH